MFSCSIIPVAMVKAAAIPVGVASIIIIIDTGS